MQAAHLQHVLMQHIHLKLIVRCNAPPPIQSSIDIGSESGEREGCSGDERTQSLTAIRADAPSPAQQRKASFVSGSHAAHKAAFVLMVSPRIFLSLRSHLPSSV